VDAAGVTYVGSLDGWLYAIDALGKARWRRRFGERIFGTAALVPGGLVVGADDDRVRWLDRAGTVRWSVPLGACPQPPRGEGRGFERVRCDVDSSPVVTPDGLIVLGGDALHALTGDGRVRFRLELGGHLRSSPALGPDGTLYVGVQGGAVVAVSRDGKKRWEHRELYDFDSTPAVAGGLVAVGCDDGRLYGLDAANGAVRFRVATRGPVRSSPAVAEDGTILFGSDDGVLRALSASGALRWSFATGGPIRSSPAVDATGAVVFGSQDDSLYALAADGTLLWRVELGGDVDSSPAVLPDGTILCGADDGALYALGR
jgi:outer membrane protein assembly factor BamB